MALTGEYELSPEGWVRDQTEKIFQTGTTDSVDIKGRPVVLVTMRGAKSSTLSCAQKAMSSVRPLSRMFCALMPAPIPSRAAKTGARLVASSGRAPGPGGHHQRQAFLAGL